jgi:ParB family transcriptional regulator, chromosome partitioning protein
VRYNVRMQSPTTPTSNFYNNAIFWVEVDKIKPNPFQPRKDFDPIQLKALSDSIKQYGVLQALVVTRNEVIKPDGGLSVEYELIAGERRLRASKMAGLREVPVLIKVGDESDLLKLELAIIENVQREDLNPVDRARAFQRLVEEFGFKHGEIAQKVGRSREYVTNSLRLLVLPQEILDALSAGNISEGHARPLGMLNDRPEEQATLLKEIMFKRLTVREAEAIARRIAYDKVRKKERMIDPEIVELEQKLAESFGTRVHIERKDNGGKVMIDFFSADDLRSILNLVQHSKEQDPRTMLHRFEAAMGGAIEAKQQPQPVVDVPEVIAEPVVAPESTPLQAGEDDRTPVEVKAAEESDDIYSLKNFTI